ncbi:MAG: MFS transporter [Candidatus Binataceae bacterium]
MGQTTAHRTGAEANGQSGKAEGSPSASFAIIGAIVILLVYQGYTLSVAGVASPWIAKSFDLSQPALARLFAWMSVSAFGSLVLARLADRVGRRRIIIASLFLTPLFSAGAALSPHAFSFAIFEILISALLGGSVSSAIVLLAEELPVERRAQGQGFAAFASAVGGVLGYLLIPFLLKWGYSWRWLLAPSVAGAILVWPVARMLPAETRFARKHAVKSRDQSHFYDILHPLYRRRSLTLLACAALDTMAGTAVNGWLYFEAVSIIGLAPGNASTLVVAGMVVGMIGFPIGAWTSEHLGRVPTVAWFGGAAWLGAIGFYWGPAGTTAYPMIFLLATYCWFKVGSSIMTVGANTAATELFPADLRTTMVGWQMITGAVFSMLTQVAISGLIGPLGGLENVIRYFALLGIPSAILFGAFIDETRGMTLAAASKEAQWDSLRGLPESKADDAAEDSAKAEGQTSSRSNLQPG